MSRKLKGLGLAMIAVLALSAMSATAAQANNVTAPKYPVTLTGLDTNSEHGKLARLTVGNGARYVECTTANLQATIGGPTTAVTVTPTYANCFSNGLTAVPATVTMGTCDFVLEATSKTTGQANVKCTTAGDAIQVHVYENHTKHTENKPLCTYDIGPQAAPITGAEITHTNVGTETEDLVLKLANLKTFAVTSTIGGLVACGTAPGATTGSLKGTYTITGEDGAENHIPIMIG